MPSARDLESFEKIKNQERRRTELLTKSQAAEVRQCMEKFPACIPHLLSKLTALNMRMVNYVDAKAAGGNAQGNQGHIPPSLQQAAANRRRKLTGGDSIVSVADGAPEATPSKYNKIESCSVLFLSDKLLEKIEPGTLSVPSLRRMLTRGKAEANKSMLAQIFELGTGMPGDTPLTGPLSDLAHLQEQSFTRYTIRGRRCRDLSLPPVWSRDGLFMIGKCIDQEVEVFSKFTNAMKKVPAAFLPAHKHISMLSVEYNWSETRACIRSSADPSGCHDFALPTLFSVRDLLGGLGGLALEDDHPHPWPTDKRRRLAGKTQTLALADGDPSTSSNSAAPQVGGGAGDEPSTGENDVFNSDDADAEGQNAEEPGDTDVGGGEPSSEGLHESGDGVPQEGGPIETDEANTTVPPPVDR